MGGITIVNRAEYCDSIVDPYGTELCTGVSGIIRWTRREDLQLPKYEFQFKFKPDLTDLSECFRRITYLKTIPQDLFVGLEDVTNFSRCFDNCSYLEEIPYYLFNPCKKVTNFHMCFANCDKLTSGTPGDEQGIRLWERAGKPGYPAEIDGKACFYNCVNMSDYDLIPRQWTAYSV